MAPALTQASEPLNLAEATRHTSSPFFSKYKCLKVPASLLNGNTFGNGEKCTAGLASPVFRGSECHSPPSVFGHTMEESPTLPNSESDITEEAISRVPGPYTPSPEYPNAIISDMGCHTNSINLPLAAEAPNYNPKVRDTPESIFASQQNELLNIMGRDLGNVNDIIDTLQKLVSNPSLLDAAESELSSSAQASQPPVEETMEERAASIFAKLAARQKHLEKKKEILLRRIRRVSARGLTAAVSSQLDYLVSRGSKLCHNTESVSPIGYDSLQADTMKSMTTTDLVSFVKKVEASQYQRNRSQIGVNRDSPAALPETLCVEADYIVAEMKSATLAQVGHDSDATESSSGGESCDEMETFQSTNYKPIKERAYYKYYHKRGWIASKWAWLRAQIADLDYKISQQEKVYMQLRSSKGDLTFLEECDNGNKVKKILNKSHLDSFSSSYTNLRSMRFPVNGYHPVAPLDEQSSSENSCARTLSVSRLKRRRYIRPSSVLRRNRRSYMGSSLSLSAYDDQNKSPSCCCIAPLTCVLCTNLQSNSVYNVYGMQFVKTRDLASLVQNRQNIKEKLAKVDPSFHPILSKQTEMLQNEVYTNSLNKFCFQEKILAIDDDLLEDDLEEECLPKRKKRDLRDLRRRRRDGLKLNIDGQKCQDQDLLMEDDDWDVPVTNHESFLDKKYKLRNDSSNLEKSKKSVHKNKLSTNSYDIDNIVIPQSMASISLVETLPYKEIMTPKWRICEISPIHSSYLNDSDEIEDISEEAFKARHAVSEEKERKYFQSIQLKANQRFHRSRRADSSGTSTPDQPMSPRPIDTLVENSPIGSPLVEQAEDTYQWNKSEQSINNNNTVLTLSLSAIQSSIDDSSENAMNGPNMDSNIPSPVSSDSTGTTTRSNRLASTNSDKFFRPITPASSSHECEKECISPFPCRDFPLDENEFETLIKQKGKGACRKQTSMNNIVDKSKENVFEMEKDKNGPESALSDVTDSAPEDEDVCYHEDGTPDWTICAVKDSSGACMLQVQRN